MHLTVAGFLGENRALHPLVLPEGVGATSSNQKPGRGDLRPLKSPATVASVPAGQSTIYRMGRDSPSDTSYWLSWPSVVHAVRGFIADDTTERTYYTGDPSGPRVTDNTMALTGAPYPTASRLLGVPAPTGPLTVTLNTAGTSTVNETRYYVYTFVTDWGEEGPPSPVSNSITLPTSGTTNLSGFTAAPAGYTQINRIRIYRTATGDSGGTAFFFLSEVTSWGATVDDNRNLGEGIATANYLPPPSGLKNLTGMWDGMMAGISGRSVVYCEPYLPYAWPSEFETIPPDCTPVALAKFGQSLLILTTSKPMLVSGTSPDGLDELPLEIPHSCCSSRSALGMGHGVVWASPSGLMYYGQGGGRILTAGIMTRDDWQAINPTSIVGCQYEGIYIGFYTVGGVTKGFMIDPLNPTGMYFLDAGYAAAFNDDLQDGLYVLNGANIQKWDQGAPMTAIFKSKTYKLPHPVNLCCAEVISDSYPVTFKLYGDGVLRHTQTVTSNDGFWLTSGYLAQEYAVQLETSSNIQQCVVADSLDELKAA